MRPLAVAALVMACRGGTAEPREPAHVVVAAAAVPPDAPPPDASDCPAAAPPYDEDTLQARIAYLASAELDGRAPGTAGDLAARAFVVQRFRCLGLRPAGDGGGFEQAFDGDTANVVGYLPGTDAGGDLVVVGAHLDHLGATADGHFLGANDNASGVVALLAIAQAIHERAAAPRRTIAFVAFGAEEQGMRGSSYFAAHAPPALPMDRVVYDVNLDMVGSYASRGWVAAMGTFRGLPGRALIDELARAHPRLHVGVGGRGVGSDHQPFCDLGIPYVFFWTPDTRCYHATCDTPARIDHRDLAEIAQLAGDLVARLADSELDLRDSRARLGCTGRAHARRQ